MNTRLSKGANPSDTLSLNMNLHAHHELEGFGGIGEGINIQQAPDGRRILWLAHESAPKNFTGVDVTDPRKPKVVVQTDLPHESALQLAYVVHTNFSRTRDRQKMIISCM